jgi:hypothetical protein
MDLSFVHETAANSLSSLFLEHLREGSGIAYVWLARLSSLERRSPRTLKR